MKQPTIEFERAPCPRCGARTIAEAEGLCEPMRDETGEGTCPAEHEDAEGFLLQPSAASIQTLGAWIDQQVQP